MTQGTQAMLTHAVLVATTCAALPSAGWGQTPPASRWLPWVGCWTVTTDASRGQSSAADTNAPGTAGRSARVCVAAAGETATITTAASSATPLTQTIVTDGSSRAVSDGTCAGSQSAQWSRDGHRMYTRAELTCAGARRTVSGVSLLAADGAWVETQAITIGGRDSVRVRRFTREGPAPAEARTVARRVVIDDVTDMTAHVATPAIEAALVETRATFPLTAARLIELDDAKVPAPLIDLMVALTFPQAYRVETTSVDRVSTSWIDEEPWYPAVPWWTASSIGAAYYDSSYFLSPFGYSYLGGYPLFGAPAVVVGGGRPNRNRDTNLEEGRAVNGFGYTRVVPRQATPTGEGGDGSSGGGSAGTRGSGTATATTRGYTKGGSVDASSSAPPAGTSSGSSGGSSSAGGSTDAGRTAVPR